MRPSLIESRPAGEKAQSSYPAYPATPPDAIWPHSSQLQAARPARQHGQRSRYAAGGRVRTGSFQLRPAEGWSPLLLLAASVYAVVYAIINAGWLAGGTTILLYTTAFGLLLGLGVAKVTRIPQSILHLGACLAGYWLAIWFTSAVALHIPWFSLLINLRSVLTGGLAAAPYGGSQTVFLFYLSFLTFFLGYFGAWLIYRAHLPWLVALVYCSIMLVNLQSARVDLSFALLVLLAALLLLIGRMQLNSQLARWMYEGLHTDRAWLRAITYRFMTITAVLTLALLPLSVVLPSFDQPPTGISFWNVFDTAWNNVTQGQFSLSNPGSIFQGSNPSANFFGDQLSITGSVNLPTGEVLTYTSSAGKQGQYLEGLSFDHFDGHTWTSLTTNQAQPFSANSNLPFLNLGNFSRVTTDVTLVTPPQGSKQYIFAPDQPRSFSMSTVLYGNDIPEGYITAWTQQGALTASEQYQVISIVPDVSTQTLSAIPLPSQSPAAWRSDPSYLLLKGYYLQLPNDLSPSVVQTARQWTQSATNAYDAMRLLQAHLSDPTRFTYSITNKPVPPNMDAVSWLLQTRRGFCTYYATAMAVMARQLGFPARVVNGFSQGQYDTKRQVWVVDGNDAHSWVQVYFPNQGWISFDPTPGFSLAPSGTTQPTPTVTSTPNKPVPTAQPTQPKKNAHPTPTTGSTGSTTPHVSSNSLTSEILFLVISLAILGLAMLMLGFSLYRYRENKRLMASSMIAGTYWRLARLAGFTGLAPRTSQTPYEYTRQLARYFPQAQSALWHITHLFVRERWGAPQHRPAQSEEQSIQRLWPRLRITILRALLLRKKREPGNL